MVAKATRHGARVHFYTDGVILVKQTVKSLKTDRFVLDTHPDRTQRTRHIDPGDDTALCHAIRLAGQGKL